jgi:hypothetical protein
MKPSNTDRNDGKGTWSVVVLFEDASAREQGVRFCNHLIERYWAEQGFDVSWYSFSMLQAGEESAEKAAAADIIVFAMHPEGEMPLEIRDWVENWVRRRGDREGALVGLMDRSAYPAATGERYIYLRNAAHRAGMDYWTQLPQNLHGISDSIESYSERAKQVTSVLDEILQQHAHPTLTP